MSHNNNSNNPRSRRLKFEKKDIEEDLKLLQIGDDRDIVTELGRKSGKVCVEPVTFAKKNNTRNIGEFL
jgi:hypothetical protein